MRSTPHIIFDKSFIESLNPRLVDELTMYFSPVCPPILIREIIADLRHPEPRQDRLPKDLVRALAAKMAKAHGPEPSSLREMVVYNLRGGHIPLTTGQVPIDTTMHSVKRNRDQTGIMIDGTIQQAMWERWLHGQFDSDEVNAAEEWRQHLAETDLESMRVTWQPFAAEIGNPTTLRETTLAVDEVLSDRSPQTQREIIRLATGLVKAEEWQTNAAYNFFADLGRGALVKDYAQFAAITVRLYLIFSVGLARGFIGPRASNIADLEYLFYAPFCHIFVSRDKLHRMLWEAGAVISPAMFVWGDAVKADLKRRAASRDTMSQDEWIALRKEHGIWPEPADGSPIYAAWERSMPPSSKGPRRPVDMSKITPEIMAKLREWMRSFDE